MASDPRRAALLRWGDTIYTLALILTAHPDRAAQVTLGAFQQALAKDADDLELVLLTALVHQAGPRRAPRLRRARSGDLDQLPPLDRLLLALWLLRALSGPRLAAVFGVPADEIVARLDTALGPDTTTVGDGHLDRPTWLRLRLDLAADAELAAHLRACAACRAHVTAWQAVTDRVAERLRTATAGAHLPPAVATTMADPAAPVRTRPRLQRTAWLVVAASAALIAVLVVPWSRPRAPVTVPRSPQALVDAALTAWDAAPASGVVHTDVRAVPLWPADADVLSIHVWQAADGRHRYEALRGEALVEWQLGDGTQTLRYAAQPRFAACRWATGVAATAARFTDRPLVLRATALEQQAALTARLREGAYGTGYVLLQRARLAPDLRTLGTRALATGTAAVLHFTDHTQDPPHPIVLTIDPRAGLQQAQAVTTQDGQTRTREMWRLVQQTPVAQVPPAVPSWPGTASSGPLLDPACPALDAQVAVAPRAWALVPGTPMVLSAVPAGATAAWFAGGALTDVVRTPGLANALSVIVSRPGSRLALTLIDRGAASQPQTTAASAQAEQRRGNGWTLLLAASPSGVLSGWLALQATPEDQQAWYRLWSVGWTRDDVEAVARAFAPRDAYTVLATPAGLWDASPLSPDLEAVLTRALGATRPTANVATEATLTITTRTEAPAARPADPYYGDAGSTMPPQTQLRQIVVADAAGVRAARQDLTGPDGTVLRASASDVRAGMHYDAAAHVLWRGPGSARTVTELGRPLTLDLLGIVLGPGTLAQTSDGAHIVIERRWPFRADAGVVPLAWPLPRPATHGLRAGEVVARLTFAAASAQVRAVQLEHHDETGTITLLSEVAVTQRPLAAPPPADALLAVPSLPADVLTVRGDGTIAVPVTDSAGGWLARSWSWSPTVATVVTDTLPTAPSTRQDGPTLGTATWAAFPPGGLWRSTTYRFAPGGETVTLTQGPAALLGAALRTSRGQRWTRSEVQPVTVGGQEHAAWLLADGNRAALIITIDDLLLHLTVPPNGASGVVGAALPQLTATGTQAAP